ncbi:MAG: hypothetical protein HN565_04130, partial [Rhodospirillales bacterium]|nr:hypothetical protein [Rhodospirillales bacterium]
MADSTPVMVAPVKGALWMTAAAASFALMTWSIRALVPMGPSEIIFMRSLFGLVMVLPWLKLPKGGMAERKNMKFFGLRGVLSYLAMMA